LHGCKWKIVAIGTPSSSVPFLPSLPLLPLEVGPSIAARGFGGALKLPQRVWAKPGRQTPSGAFSGYLDIVFGKHFHTVWNRAGHYIFAL